MTRNLKTYMKGQIPTQIQLTKVNGEKVHENGQKWMCKNLYSLQQV